MSIITSLVTKQREHFNSGVTRDLSFRIDKLKRLKKAIIAHESKISEALAKDLGKSPFESYATEIGIILSELSHAISHLPKWSKPKRVRTPIVHFIAKSFIYPEPRGVALIMSPWNYPFQLTIAPLIGAIAAGNCAIIKPSAYTPQTSHAIAAMIRETFDDSYIAVIEGGRAENQALLDEKFDYIFFTGSTEVGKTVMAAASKHLTPITLELGGKSPCIIDNSANISIAVRRIAWGKYLNAGQTCVAPDYLYVHENVKGELIAGIKYWITKFFGAEPAKSPDFGRIVNDKHVARLTGLLKSGSCVCGGEVIIEERFIAPTILDKVTWNDPVMQEEIFGPILPVLTFNSLDEVVAKVNSRPKPLALYIFSSSRKNQKYILRNIQFGGGCINDTITHLATPYMPFNGVGESGLGGYHGKASFDTFTNFKSIMKKSTLIDLPIRYAPYKGKMGMLKMFLK